MSDSNKNKQRNLNNCNTTKFLSQGFESLVKEQLVRCPNNDTSQPSGTIDYDIVIIGSGYGGAIAASELSSAHRNQNPDQPLKICMLERGKEYLPGMFPSKMADLPGHIRYATPESTKPGGLREGLFDFRLGNGVSTLIANGLGGGSLINAGVMEVPKKQIFESGWPDLIKCEADKLPYDEAKELLGASVNGIDNTIDQNARHRTTPLKKHISLKTLGEPDLQNIRKNQFRPAAITVAMEKKTTNSGIELTACNLCGDCATGCNFSAKESLDCNLLVKAKKLGVELYTGASVHKLRRSDDNNHWIVEVNYTNHQLALRQGKAICLSASKVIVAAGSLGSTELLLRSQNESLRFSSKLGQRFSSNGDMIAASFDQNIPANAVANEETKPDERCIGPTITGVIDLNLDNNQESQNIIIEEMAIPGPLNKFFSESVTTINALHNLATPDKTKHRKNEDPEEDPLSVSEDKIYATSVYAIMGDDGAKGSLTLPEQDLNDPSEGNIKIQWPDLPDHPLFDTQLDTLSNLAKDSDVQGHVFGNGLWRPLPAKMEYLTNGAKGPLMTVHPLGGCAMADSPESGVVNHLGQVFDPNNTKDGLHDGLVVLDGSIIPTSIGTNPALTISALSLRAIRQLRDNVWCEYQDDMSSRDKPHIPPEERPIYRDAMHPTTAIDTEVQVRERLVGNIATDSGLITVELTLKFKDKPIKEMTKPFDLEVDSGSQIRIFDPKCYERFKTQFRDNEQFETLLNEKAIFIAELSGSLAVFGRDKSYYRERQFKAMWNWARSRGLRDLYQFFEEQTSDDTNDSETGGIWDRVSGAFSLASRSGEIRLFEYKLTLEKTLKVDPEFPHLGRLLSGKTIEGAKRFTYSKRSNPWRQLQEMSLSLFPGMLAQHKDNTPLALDTKYLARIGHPLMRLSKQENHVNALADLASFFAYVFRLTINIHSWTFRLPDTPSDKQPDRFPGPMEGMPDPVIKEFCVGKKDDGQPAYVRLTRYPNYASDQPPIVMIHGYSVSGNTFIHPKVKPNLASYFWEQGRDIWVLDLRTSAAMPTAQYPWTFEDVAYSDIPVAFDYIYRQCGYKQVDVLAHCMGAAMFSMAILSSDIPTPSALLSITPKLDEMRKSLHKRIHKVAFSQVGPTPVFSPANIFRGYVTHFVSHIIDELSYSFQASKNPGLLEQLWDRLLYSLPYPEEEYDLENPPWRFWAKRRFVSTRHRMDALYGRDFNLKNIEPALYDYFDDLFGPLSLKTVNQVTHFSRLSLITDHKGNNSFVHRDHLEKFWPFPTMSFHGKENGLVDPITGARMTAILKNDAGLQYYKPVYIEDYGHQDCLIGKDRVKNVYSEIDDFFNQEPDQYFSEDSAPAESDKSKPNIPNRMTFCALTPDMGPIRTDQCTRSVMRQRSSSIGYRFTASPAYPEPILIVTLPVHKTEDGVTPTIAEGHENTNLAIALACQFSLPTGQPGDWINETLGLASLPTQCEGVITLLIHNESPLLSSINFGDKSNLELITDPEFGTGSEKGLDTLIKRLLEEIGKAILYAFKHINQLIAQNTIWLNYPQANSQAEETADSFRFAFGSCQYSADISDKEIAYNAYHRLNQIIEKQDNSPEMLLLLGDQIYADASAGLFDPRSYENRFEIPYQRFYSNQHVSSVMKQVPVHTLLDDHEIDNNFEPIANNIEYTQIKKTLDEYKTHGTAAFLKHQRGVSSGTIWQALNDYPVPFFLANTRTERELRNATTFRHAKIMHPDQFSELQKFLMSHQHSERPIFIASPSAVLPRRLEATEIGQAFSENCLRSDAWDGYPASLYALLGFIFDKEIENIVFLSGDEHISSITEIELSDQDQKIECRSIHSSGTYAPYPFANSEQAALFEEDTFEFTYGKKRIQCMTKTTFTPNDGFARVNCKQISQGKWHVDVDFDRA